MYNVLANKRNGIKISKVACDWTTDVTYLFSIGLQHLCVAQFKVTTNKGVTSEFLKEVARVSLCNPKEISVGEYF
jgi:hypothetical protein